MNTPVSTTRPNCWRLGAAVLALGTGFAPQAHASLLGDAVTVQLLSPNGLTVDSTPVNLSDAGLVVSPGVEISAGDGSQVGSFLLAGATASESIDIRDSSIVLRLLAGYDDGGILYTGYAPGGRYVFSSLDFPGQLITSVSASSSGISNFSNTWVTLVNPSTVSFALDAIQFIPATSGTSFGDVTLTLTTQPVPEPATYALMALGLALVGLAARRQRAS